MKSKPVLPLALAALTLCGSLSAISWAEDLDDGISKSTDDPISAADQALDPDKNIRYIITKAKSKAGGKDKGDGSGNMNSVILGPGSNVKGDVIILDQSKGPKTQVVQ